MAHKVWHHHGQMSEAFRTVMFLSASGGLQDAAAMTAAAKQHEAEWTAELVRRALAQEAAQ